MLIGVQHFFHDFALLFAYLWQQTLATFQFYVNALFSVIGLMRGFLSSAFSSPVETDFLPFASGVFDILNTIPAFSVLAGLIGIGLITLFFIVSIKTFQNL